MNIETETPALPGVPRRLMALIYDSLLVLAILLLGTFPWVLPRGAMQDGTLNPEPLGPLYQCFCLALISGYFVLGWRRKQATLGMRSWRLQLIGLNGEAPSYQQLFIRAFTAPVAWIPLAAGVLWQYADPNGLTWHDRASGTRLVLLKKKQKSTGRG